MVVRERSEPRSHVRDYRSVGQGSVRRTGPRLVVIAYAEVSLLRVAGPWGCSPRPVITLRSRHKWTRRRTPSSPGLAPVPNARRCGRRQTVRSSSNNRLRIVERRPDPPSWIAGTSQRNNSVAAVAPANEHLRGPASIANREHQHALLKHCVCDQDTDDSAPDLRREVDGNVAPTKTALRGIRQRHSRIKVRS